MDREDGLRGGKSPREECDGAPMGWAGRVGVLPKDSADANRGGRVRSDVEREGGIGEGEDGRGGEEETQGGEGRGARGGPLGGGGEAGEVIEGSGDEGEPGDVAAIIVAEAEELQDLRHRTRAGPRSDGVEFGGVARGTQA